MKEMVIEELQRKAFPLADRFFKANGHKGRARGNERIFVLRDRDNRIRAGLRACPKESGYLLRSVQVDSTVYRQGLGLKLVTETVALLKPRACWCYPYAHLQAFYEKCGFTRPDGFDSPEDIRQPLLRYHQQGHSFLLMTTCAATSHATDDPSNPREM